MLALLVLALAFPEISGAADADKHALARDLGAVLAWRLGPESVEEQCESADPEGAAIRKKALKDWLEKNAELIKQVDARVAEIVPLAYPSASDVDNTPRVRAKIKAILLEEIFSGKTPEESVAICKAEANPASPRWNNSGMPQVPTSLAVLVRLEDIAGGEMKMTRLIPMLPVGSMPASVEFYQKLGFSIEHRNDDWGWAMLRFDDCRLMVDQSINKKPSAYRQGVLYLYPDNVAQYHELLRKNGLTIPDLDVTFYGMTEFRFDDPDGNRLWIGESK